MKYHPKVNDYVKWNDKVEGWVYFLGDEYITIEVATRPKQQATGCPNHKNYHLLVLCHRNRWNELEYITSRKSVHHKSNENNK